jgi:hypothetical protein
MSDVPGLSQHFDHGEIGQPVSFEECIIRTPRPPSQLVAIVDKYIKDNPARWHSRMSGLVFEALSCKDSVRKGE